MAYSRRERRRENARVRLVFESALLDHEIGVAASGQESGKSLAFADHVAVVLGLLLPGADREVDHGLTRKPDRSLLPFAIEDPSISVPKRWAHGQIAVE